MPLSITCGFASLALVMFSICPSSPLRPKGRRIKLEPESFGAVRLLLCLRLAGGSRWSAIFFTFVTVSLKRISRAGFRVA